MKGGPRFRQVPVRRRDSAHRNRLGFSPDAFVQQTANFFQRDLDALVKHRGEENRW